MSKRHIKIVEVGPRDGLQNEAEILSFDIKTSFIDQLSNTGLSHIEVSSFVNPKRIPQLADANTVFSQITRNTNVNYAALVPNEKGMSTALDNHVDSIALFTGASESFCQKNINCSVEESLQRFKPVIEIAQKNAIPVRAYVSCVVGCPYEGLIDAKEVAKLVQRLDDMGCYEISLGDTIGVATPSQVHILLDTCTDVISVDKLAVHFHDTRGQALANIVESLSFGVTTIDSSVAGLGGCPYATGSTGNVATEDVVYLLHGMGYSTGIDLKKLIEVGKYICEKTNRQNSSRVGVAGLPEFYTELSISAQVL